MVSLNLHRRHLTGSQLATCGSDVEEQLAVEAKALQKAAGGDKKSPRAKAEKSLGAKSPQAIAKKKRAPRARDKAASIVGSSPRAIQDAKAVKAADPKLHEKVKAGEVTLPRGRRGVRSGRLPCVPSRRGTGACPAMTKTKTATIQVPGLKVTVPLAAGALPADLVPMEGPAGDPVLDLVLEGGSLTVRAKLNGKNYRKVLKQVAEHGADNMAVAIQGTLRPAAEPGGPFVLEGAGFQAVVKTPRPAGGVEGEARA